MLINLETFSDKIKRVITYIYKDYGINSLEEYNNIPIATKKEILLKNYADFSKEKATFLLNSALYSNEVLKEANDYYYNKSESLITDFEYDIIFDYLKTIIDVFPTIKEKI
jgi:NAD-dependent DNA ligase adenylation domain